ncbi:MAG: general stress protein CsbD [Bacteroidetes bacterium]|nr:MAG: general stress protein CsbD [Bacteroidota bacterium]
MATDAMNESWARVMTQIQTIWSEQEFTVAELKKARGDLKKMVALINERTGEEQSDILQKITALL